MEDRLNFFLRIKISIFKIKQYSLFLKEGLNKAIGYILTLGIIIGIILGMIQFSILGTVESSIKEVLQQENFKFEINDGILDFENSPYKEEQGTSLLIIDSNKTLDQSDSIRSITVHKDISSVFLKDGIVGRYNGYEYKVKYSEIPLMSKHIDNKIVINFLNNIKPIKYIIFVLILLLTCLSLLFNALVMSLAGLITNKMNGSKLKYKDIFKISIYSLTLPNLVKLIFPIGGLSIFISVLYVTIVINNISREKTLL